MRVVIGEDSVLFREGLVRLLADRGHDVVTAVGDALSLVGAVDATSPDVVVADIRMPPKHESDGARAALTIRDRHPHVGILLLSQHIALRDCLDLIGTPGFGYLLKDRVLRLDEFDDSLARVAGGGVALDPEVVRALVRSRQAPTALQSLTLRESDVLRLVAEGHSNTAIGNALVMSERTVETHMRSIFNKLGLHDDPTTHRRVRAVVAYLESGRSSHTGS